MKYISNTVNLIEWDDVINEIEDKPGTTLRYNEQTFNRELKGFDQLDSEWQTAGYKYNDPAREWINYFPHSDF